MEKRYQVFISSTFEDLKDERQSVLKAILGLNHMPAGMELFPASDHTAWQLICDVIDNSDYYVLIIGGRYGSLNEEGISYTEKEYDYATSKNKYVIALLHSNPNNLPRGKTETEEKSWKKLQEFRKKVEKKHTCVYWGNAADLKVEVVLGLMAATKRAPAQGWVRAGDLAGEEANREIIKLQKIIEKQRDELERINTTAPAGSENLAQGNDLHTIACKTTLKKDNSSYNDPGKTIHVSGEINVTWNEIFGILGPLLMNPTRETKMRSTLGRLCSDKLLSEISSTHPEYSISLSTVSETVFQTVKVQLLALGLIENNYHVIESETGNKREVAFCELTPFGKRYLIKTTALYKK